MFLDNNRKQQRNCSNLFLVLDFSLDLLTVRKLTTLIKHYQKCSILNLVRHPAEYSQCLKNKNKQTKKKRDICQGLLSQSELISPSSVSEQVSWRALSRLTFDPLVLISAQRSTCRQQSGGRAREASLAGLHPLPPQGPARPLSVRAMFSAIR